MLAGSVHRGGCFVRLQVSQQAALPALGGSCPMQQPKARPPHTPTHVADAFPIDAFSPDKFGVVCARVTDIRLAVTFLSLRNLKLERERLPTRSMALQCCTRSAVRARRLPDDHDCVIHKKCESPSGLHAVNPCTFCFSSHRGIGGRSGSHRILRTARRPHIGRYRCECSARRRAAKLNDRGPPAASKVAAGNGHSHWRGS